MKINQRLKQEIEKFKDYIIVVEGKKDSQVLKSFGFSRVFEIHKTGVPIRERVEYICSLTEKKDRICILTDLDRQGKKLYEFLKPIFQEHGAKLDSTFRGILIKSKISHIEGLSNFLRNVEEV
jgi:5S rRNA maturation endonuclease (ribonuclease M5)